MNPGGKYMELQAGHYSSTDEAREPGWSRSLAELEMESLARWTMQLYRKYWNPHHHSLWMIQENQSEEKKYLRRRPATVDVAGKVTSHVCTPRLD